MPKDKKGLFSTLEDLLENLFTIHVDNARLDRIIEMEGAILQGQTDAKAAQETIVGQQAILQADLLSIKAFLGVPDLRIGATQEQLDALGQRVQKTVENVAEFDKSTTEPA